MATKTIDRSPPTVPASRSYKDDLFGWVEDQVALLQAHEVGSIDASHIKLELTELGRSEYDKLVSAIRVVLLHLLKWDHQPERRSRSWVLTIEEHRDRITSELDDNPSLQPRVESAIGKAYKLARRQAIRETRLPAGAFPEACQYDWKVVTERSIPQEDDLPWE